MAKIAIERLKQIPLTGNLAPAQIESLLPRVQEVSLSRGAILFRQGDPATHLYFVERGRVSETEKDTAGRHILHRYAGQGEYLGRYGMVTGKPYRVTATIQEDTSLLAIPLRDLQPILFAYSDWRSWFFHTRVAARMRAIPLFKDFGDWDIYRLADQVEVQDFEEGTTIFHAGTQAASFYVIDQGQVMETPGPSMRPPGQRPIYLAVGNFLGQESLERNTPYKTTTTARKKTRLYRIPGPALQELIQDRVPDPDSALRRVHVQERLGGVSLFSRLSDQQLQLLAGYTSLVLRRPGDIVARQGEPASALMILDDGEAIVRRQIGQERPRPVGYLKARPTGTGAPTRLGQPESVYFGAHALLADEMRGATVEVMQTSSWIVLERSDFHRFLADAGLTRADLGRDDQPEEQADIRLPSEPEHLDLPFETRRHWIVAARRLMGLVIAMLLVAVLILADVTILDLQEGLATAILLVGVVVLGILVVSSVWRYADWWYDTCKVTNQAVIHVEKVPLIREDRYEAPLEQIQNVGIQVGPLGRILGYGTLSIDTAAVKGQIEFTEIPKPGNVQELILAAAEVARGGQRIQVRESIRRQLEDRLYPERLEPTTPGSILIQTRAPEPSPGRPSRFRTFRDWLPRSELREPDSITWRKHWLNLLQRAWLPIVAFLITSGLLVWQLLALLRDEGGLFLAMLLLWIVAVLPMLYQYIDWRNDVYIVTDDEVIDVEKQLLFFPIPFFFYSEDRKQASLEKVQNVNLRVPGFVANVLDFGDVIVQTAGTEGTLDFLFVANPRHVQAEILRRLAKFREREQERESEERFEDMAEWFETYRDVINRTDRRP